MVSWSYLSYALRQTILNYLLLYLINLNLKGLTIFEILKDEYCTLF
jgi:hypothetical protein